MNSMESIVVHRDFHIQHGYWTGPTIGKFLTELRDNKRIVGNKCVNCNIVFTPPVDICPKCFTTPSEWVEVKDTGTMVAHTVVYHHFPGQPMDPPYVLGLIKLDGSDTNMVHLIDLVGNSYILKNGMRVKAVWEEEREGNIRDIKHFEEMEA